jgi:ribosomal protein S27AE
MSKKEELLEAWDFVSSYVHADDTGYANIIEKVVHKSIPQPVNYQHVMKQFGLCPRCKSNVNMRLHRHYCGNCGQELQWEER